MVKYININNKYRYMERIENIPTSPKNNPYDRKNINAISEGIRARAAQLSRKRIPLGKLN